MPLTMGSDEQRRMAGLEPLDKRGAAPPAGLGTEAGAGAGSRPVTAIATQTEVSEVNAAAAAAKADEIVRLQAQMDQLSDWLRKGSELMRNQPAEAGGGGGV